jgi:serine/threonine-protein kinase RsbW
MSVDDGAPNSPSRRPDLALTVPAHADSLAVIRELLRGLDRQLAGRAGLLDEALSAVSEAANNAIMHAYANRQGRLSVDVSVGARLEIRVRDWGRGIGPWARPLAPRGVGLMAIEAFTDEYELRAGKGGGTEVWLAWDEAHGIDPDRGEDRALPALGGDFVIGARPGAHLGGSIGRVTALLAARANFTVDQVEGAQGVGEDIMAYVEARDGAALAGSHLSFVLCPRRRRLDLRAGALNAGHARALGEALEIDGDDRQVVADPRQREWLELVLRDPR